MTLLSLLFALLLERVTTKTDVWRAQYHVGRYLDWLTEKEWLTDDIEPAKMLLWSLVPSVAVWLVLDMLGYGVLGLVLNTLVLYVCLGCPQLRATYKCFLQAANRGDLMACELHAEMLGHQQYDDTCGSFGQQLVWLNYTHYAAVIIAFIALGAPGAVLYVVVQGFIHHTKASDYPEDTIHFFAKVGFLLDFIPVRITALGFMLVGHFGRAFSVWVTLVFNVSVSAKQLLCHVSRAAEDVEPLEIKESDPETVISEPKILVKLAKRNVMFLVATVSLLTVAGAL